ncbi:MAG: PAS domain S-box protein [Treponema sp.]|jgi:PAS domain S-box-containing protein|nr:PAS domain S-box protein [Treponema sp.]
MGLLSQGILPFVKNSHPVPARADDYTMPTEQDLVRAGALLARERNFRDLVSVFVEQAQDISRVDMTAFYILKDADDRKSDLKLIYKRGRYSIPETISGTSELVRFLRECREALIYNNKQALEKDTAGKRRQEIPHFFKEVLIHPAMKSGMALPIVSPPREIGILFTGSQTPCFFNRRRFHFLDSYTKLAGGAMQTSRLFDETRESSRKIDSLERYQENVFNSMTNMVVTTDAAGYIYYFNEPATQSMGLEEGDLGRSLENTFRDSLSSKALKTIIKCLEEGTEILGLEGIYRSDGKELDYSLNITPLKTPRGKKEGLTLLFTNQTREKELKQTVHVVTEEKRMIKDMFCRYMSQEVLTNLMESPDGVKLGGDKRIATVFFADIRGYTSFSEKREPEKIVEILNEYFSEAVENVVKYKGYIDKFIGDCIMAVWGVPMLPEKDDAINAVSCALAIQQMVRSGKRKFFKKEASRLRVGIGVNTGPLVAGNLGSVQRMDYSVIGDTVNLASRLEGVAGADEVIISHETRNQLGDTFRFEERQPVQVKGKEKPIKIYNVLGFN